MGISIYVKGYYKEPDCITGELKVLGWYEVNDNKIHKFLIPDSEAVFHSDFEVIKLVKSEFYYHGFVDEAEFLFFDGCINNMSGWGIRSEGDNTYLLVFDAKRILAVINKLLVAFEKIKSRIKNADSEKADLLALKNTLELIVNADGLVQMTRG